ncbi:hypothetical protein [Chroococcidiopsis sp. SAG 2025]|nr:hypothetical protein [Chroococcidiopsis sp. SAG 2025]
MSLLVLMVRMVLSIAPLHIAIVQIVRIEERQGLIRQTEISAIALV